MADRLRILLVDDSDSSLRLLGAFLQNICPDPVTCLNGKEAVDTFKAQPFDLVIMDVMMPVMNGIEATEAMRTHEREQGRSPIPILLLSGNDTPEEILRYVKSGISAFLPKPIGRDDLLDAVRQHTSPF